MQVIRHKGSDLLLQCRIKTRSSRNEWGGVHGGAVVIRLTAAPVDGKANAALKKFLAKAFATAPSRIEILRGQASQQKLLRIGQPKRTPEVLKTFLCRS